MADKITIGVDADTSAFEKKVSDLEKKISNMRQFGAGGATSQLANQYRTGGQEDRAKRLEEFRERQSARARQELNRDLKKQEGQLDNLLKKHQAINSIIDKQLVGGQSKMKLLEREAQLLDEINKKTKDINQAKSTLNFQGPGVDRGAGFGPFSGRDLEFMRRGMGGGRGIRGGIAAMGRSIGPLGMLGGAGAVLGAAGTAVGAGGSLYGSVITQEERQAGARAGIAGAVGELSQLQAQQRGYEMNFFGPERMAAMEASRNRMTATRVGDATTLGASFLGGAGAGAAIGGTAGAYLGSPLGPAGIGAGAIIGTAGGAIVGGVSGLAANMFDDRKRSMIFDPEAYDQFVGAEGAEAYKSSMEVYKAQNFEKIRAQDFFEDNRKNMRQLQRTFGLSDEELFEGEESLFQRASRAGFTGETIGQSAMAFQQAGGTSRDVNEASIISSQMQRGLDLTNAPSLMGQISGRTGAGAEASKDEIIRMYAEATRMGLDASEVRGLLETSTQISMQSGVSADEIQQALQSGVNVQSRRGIQAAESAFGRIRQKTGQMGGIRGQMAMAEFGSEEMTQLLQGAGEEGAEGFSFKEIGYLTSQSVDKISADNDAVAGMLLKRGIDPESEQGQKIISEMRKRSVSSTILNEGRKEALDKVRKNQSENLFFSPEERDRRMKMATSEAAQFGVLEEGSGFGGQGVMEQQSEITMTAEGIASGLTQTGVSADVSGVIGRLEGDTGRLADDRERAGARDFGAEVKRLVKEMSSLRTAFKDAASSKELSDLLTQMGRLAEAGKLSSDVLEEYQKKISKVNANQTNRFVDEFFGPILPTPQQTAEEETD